METKQEVFKLLAGYAAGLQEVYDAIRADQALDRALSMSISGTPVRRTGRAPDKPPGYKEIQRCASW